MCRLRDNLAVGCAHHFKEEAMKHVQYLLVVSGVLVSLGAHAEMKDMPGGLWEIRTKVDMPGMPPEIAAKMGNRLTTKCIQPGERKWNEQPPPNGKGERQCEQTEMKVSGNTSSWKMKCADGRTGEGTITHNNKDAYKMDMVMSTPRGSMKMQLEGKRIADSCEKK
jgi:hypothetical protein